MPVVKSGSGIADADGNVYKQQPDGSFVKVDFENDRALREIDKASLEPYQNIVLSDGSTWRYQPGKDGKFDLVIVARPKPFVTLSPNDPSRHGKHTGSGSSK